MFSPVSILVVTALSSILSILVLISLLSHAIDGVPRWLWANVLAIVSLVLFAVQSVVPAWLGVVAANQLLAATILLIYEGCNDFFDVRMRPAQRWTGWIMWLGVMAGIVYFTYAVPDAHVRVVIVSAFHAACDLAIAGRVLIERPEERPRYNYLFVAGAAARSARSGIRSAARSMSCSRPRRPRCCSRGRCRSRFSRSAFSCCPRCASGS